MIKQVLLFKFKSDPSEFFAEYKKLENLDCIKSIEFGPNISTEGDDKGYTHAAIVSFPSSESVNEFLNHPDHIQLAEKYLSPILEDIIIIDFES